jgi:hypothetical protein
MRSRFPMAGAVAVLGLLVLPALANASTLGITAQPSGSSASTCDSSVAFAQVAEASGTPYIVPAGGGLITGWETVVTTDDTAGSSLEFIVVGPASSEYTVVGTDTETLPSPLPAAGGLVSFPLTTPIAVQAGDTIGLYSASVGGVDCYFASGSTPTGADIAALGFPTNPPAAGETSTLNNSAPFTSEIDVAATLVQNQDAAVTTSAGSSGASAGQAALLSSTVTDNGPGAAPITFTDPVPSGLTIDSAVAGDGTCSASGQTVTCTISGLAVGQSAPVDVVVTPSSPGTYTKHVSVAVGAGLTDPNLANNSASETLTVGRSVPAKCVVPALKGASQSLAKALLKDLGCKVKTAKAHSKSVHKGSVVKSKPGKGSYAYQRTITLVISSGPKKKKK